MWPASDPVGLARALLRIFAAESAPPMLRYLMATLDRALLGLGPAASPEACALLTWKPLALRGEPGDLAAQQAERLGMRARILLRCGQHEAARQAFREWRAAFERVHAPDLLDFLFAIQTVEEALLEFADDALLERIMDRLAPLDELRHWWLGSGPDYLRGAIALRLGEIDAAARYFEAGRNWAEEEGIAFVAGRCHEGLAGVATQRGDQATADVHLETAERYLIEAGAPGTSRVTTPEHAGFRGHPPDRTSARRERDRE